MSFNIKGVFLVAFSNQLAFAQRNYTAALYGQNFTSSSYIENIRILEDNQAEIFSKNQTLIPGFSTGLYYQALSWYYSYIGETKKAEQLFSKEMTYGDTNAITTEEYKKIRISQDYDLIKKETNRTKIVMINEAHHQPHHRIFTYNYLEELYREGYRYLLLESINHADSMLNKRKYPVLGKSCLYPEPLYGQMIRRAMNLGFKILSYDYGESDCEYSEIQPFYCANIRELCACKNVQKILMDDPSAKIVIHCGYAHIDKKTNDDWMKLAELIKIMTSINPFTINQTTLMERGSQKCEYHEYQYLKSNIKLNKTSFLTDSLNRLYSPPSLKGYSDSYLIHPPVNLNENNRPSYLYEMNGVSKYIFNPASISEKIKEGYLVQAFSLSEVNGVPFDQFIISKTNTSYALYLPHGKYEVRFLNMKGETVLKREIAI